MMTTSVLQIAIVLVFAKVAYGQDNGISSSYNQQVAIGQYRPNSQTTYTQLSSATGSSYCTDQLQKCSYWGSTGECYTNPTYMHAYCKQSCGLCGTSSDQGSYGATRPIIPVNSYNHNPATSVSSSYGRPNGYNLGGLSGSYGTGSYGTGSTYGTGSYGSGPAIPSYGCTDLHIGCGNWAAYGHCTINPSYMLQYCRLSCGSCGGQAIPNYPQQPYLGQVSNGYGNGYGQPGYGGEIQQPFVTPQITTYGQTSGYGQQQQSVYGQSESTYTQQENSIAGNYPQVHPSGYGSTGTSYVSPGVSTGEYAVKAKELKDVKD